MEVRRRFIAKGYPRLVVFTLIALSGLAAFGFSTLLFRLGVEHMGSRYLTATAVGYGVFMLLLALWIELNRPPESRSSVDAVDLTGGGSLDIGGSRTGFSGGSSGGAGASASWEGSAIRHTWKPALVIAACVFVVGVVVQWAMPTARTIGDVLR